MVIQHQSPEGAGGESEVCSTYPILAGQEVSEMLKFLNTMHQALQKMSKERGKQSPVLQSVLTKAQGRELWAFCLLLLS